MGGSFTILDICLLCLFIPPVISGLMKGFIEQAASLIALILGIWAACHFSHLLGTHLAAWINSNPAYINILAFIIIFIVVLVCVFLIGKFSSKLIDLVMLGWLDKLLGILFSILKAALIISIVIYILNSLDAHLSFLPKDTISHSRVYLFLQDIAPKIFPYFHRF